MQPIRRYAIPLVVGFVLGVLSLGAVALSREGENGPTVCPSGTSPHWYSEQLLKDLPPSEVLVCRKPDGTKHGPWVRWIGGEMWVAGYFRDGKRQGASFEWGSHGVRAGLVDWVDDEAKDMSGWNAKGVKTFEETWEADGVRAVTRAWYDDGTLRARIQWRADKADGLYETWYSSGRPRVVGTYREGQRVGNWQCWDEAGETTLVTGWDGTTQSQGSRATASAEPRCPGSFEGGADPQPDGPTGTGHLLEGLDPAA